jgi:glutathione S-transferase
MADETPIRVNRAPVLPLWAAVVAERLGHLPDTALSLASTVAGTAARAKARRLGLAEDRAPEDLRAVVAERRKVRLLGKDITGIRTKGLVTFHGHCREIDAMLAGREWFLRDRVSTVDCYGLVFYGWGLSAGLPMRDLPNFTAHKERMLARLAVQQVLGREGVSLG